jgi:hypothetical protein
MNTDGNSRCWELFHTVFIGVHRWFQIDLGRCFMESGPIYVSVPSV